MTHTRKRKRFRNSMNSEDSNQSQKISRPASNQNKFKKVKPFVAQIMCPCRLRCAEKLDVLVQKLTFEKYHSQNWSGKTQLLRSLIERKPVEENLNPTKNVKKRNYISTYFLSDDEGKEQQVCLSLLSKI